MTSVLQGYVYLKGHVVLHLVEVLRYELEVCGFDFLWSQNFMLT